MANIFSDIPIWAIAAWGVITFVFSYFYYLRKGWLKEVPKLRHLTMFFLRGLGLFILGVLLANIIVQSTKTDTNQPLLITLVDDSSSMLNYKDSAEVMSQTKALLNQFNTSFSEEFKVLTYNLDGKALKADSLYFKNDETNLSAALDDIYNQYYGRNIGALVLLTDGNYNQGSQPTFVVDKFNNVPFYTIGVGDTVQKTDQLIDNVVANDIAFLDNAFPIEVTIKGVKLAGKEFTVSLLENGKEIDKSTFSHADVVQSITKIKFTVDASQIGMQEYTIQLSNDENEFNIANNTARIYVEVLDARSEILLLAEGITPDFGAIKQALVSEQNLSIDVMTINTLISENADLSKFDLIIWHNPGASRKLDVFERIRRLKKPFWYITGPKTQQVIFDRLALAPNISVTGQYDDSGIAYNEQFNLFELSRETIKAINEFPPLRVHYTKFNFPKSSAVLGFQKVGNIAKPEPLFFFGKQTEKYAVTFGEGLWNWRLGNFQHTNSHESFNELIQKSVQYLILKENKSRLRVSFPRKLSVGTNTIVNARFYNKSYEPITDPTINFRLMKKNGDEFEYSFLALDEFYQLDLGRLSFGRYDWVADVEYDGEIFQKKGSFAVEEVRVESQSTRADHQLLMQMAANRDGAFYKLSERDAIIKDIENREDINPIAYETSTYEKLINNAWWFVLLIAIFSAEWVLRRYSGGY